jgi:hypothetical protein
MAGNLAATPAGEKPAWSHVSSPLLGEFQFAAVVDASHHDAAHEARTEFTLAAERNPPRPGTPR